MDWNAIANKDDLLTEEDKNEISIINKKNYFESVKRRNERMIKEMNESKAYTISEINALSEKIHELKNIDSNDELYLNKILSLINDNKLYSFMMFLDDESGKLFIPKELINKEKHINYVFDFPKSTEVINLIILTLSKKFEGKFLYDLIINKDFHQIIINTFENLKNRYKIN